MIQLTALTKAYGGRVLLREVTWTVGKRDRIGLCGPNGAGKTTLLKMLAGLEEQDAGDIVTPADLTVGYLPQDGLVHAGRTLVDETRLAFKPLLDLKAEMHDLEARLGDASLRDDQHERMLVRYAEVQEQFRRYEGYSIDLKISTVLRGLGFSDDEFDKPTVAFSGGWQMRIALAKLLLQSPGLLLLDEPTNHLDIYARNWLEEFLASYPHSVILVSHDRYFLDAVVTRVADLSLKTITDYVGNYSHYLREHSARMEQLRQKKREQDEDIARIRMFIDRFRYQATKAAQVQSRLKMVDKFVPIEVPPERKRVRFKFPDCAKSGRTVLELLRVTKAYGNVSVFERLDLHIERGDRVALIGPNGAGKSTLMRMLSGVEAPDEGERTIGHQVVMQYFAQDEATRLDPTRTVFETLADGSPMHMVPSIRNILGGFLFEGDDVHKKAGVLSGGERTRLAVARMLLRPANTLLLDEPTNHLDLDSKDVLLDALEDFGGTLILVSHDRYFVDKLATKIIEIGGGHALIYPGGYEAFLWSRAAQAAADTSPDADKRVTKATPIGTSGPRPASAPTSTRAARAGPAVAAVPTTTAASPTREDKKRLEADQRRQRRAVEALGTDIAKIEAAIADKERELKTLEDAMIGTGFYENHDTSKPVLDRHQALMWEIGDLMHQWEELSAKAEALTSTRSDIAPTS